MKRLFVWLAGMLAIALLAGCDSGGKSADPPASVVAQARENSVLVTFPMVDGVEYWLFYAPTGELTSTNFNSVAGGKVITAAWSPQLVSGLTNGVTYYFTMNGRTAGGPGGTGTPLVSATPRLAGATWTAGAPIVAGDLRGTAFEMRVWNALRRIPVGKTRTYGQIAAAIGHPRASRAVGRACALNHVAVVVPCHRAIGADKNLHGYRWGIARKRQLLEREAAAV